MVGSLKNVEKINARVLDKLIIIIKKSITATSVYTTGALIIPQNLCVAEARVDVALTSPPLFSG